ncbi:MAG: 50S ribosomal protein L9 [bacterium]
MKVILLQNVENLGKKFDVKDIKSGYANNFLIPKGLVKRATKEALLWLAAQKEIEAKVVEEELKGFQGLASALDGQEVIIEMRIGEQGQLFEAVNAQKISEKLKELGFEVKKSQIKLENPIKELGEYPVNVHFEHNLEAEIKIIITEEK